MDESIKMPIHFNCVTLQSLCKHGRPAGKSGDVGAEEEGGSSILSREQRLSGSTGMPVPGLYIRDYIHELC